MTNPWDPNPRPNQPPPGGETPYGNPPGYGQPYGAPGGYPPGGQPPYGPPGGHPGGGQPPYGPPGGRNNVLIAGVVGVAAVVALVLVLVFVVFGGSGTDTSSPRAAAESFLDAVRDRDIDAVRSVSCEGDQPRYATAGDIPQTDETIVDYEVVDVTIDGDGVFVVTVSATSSSGDHVDDLPVPVVPENGEFLVCFSRMGDG